MLFERQLQVVLANDPVVDFGPLVRVLLLIQVDTKLGLLLGLPFVLVLGWYTFHPEDLDVVPIPSRQGVFQPMIKPRIASAQRIVQVEEQSGLTCRAPSCGPADNAPSDLPPCSTFLDNADT